MLLIVCYSTLVSLVRSTVGVWAQNQEIPCIPELNHRRSCGARWLELLKQKMLKLVSKQYTLAIEFLQEVRIQAAWAFTTYKSTYSFPHLAWVCLVVVNCPLHCSATQIFFCKSLILVLFSYLQKFSTLNCKLRNFPMLLIPVCFRGCTSGHSLQCLINLCIILKCISPRPSCAASTRSRQLALAVSWLLPEYGSPCDLYFSYK